jgi:hypothetical protein
VSFIMENRGREVFPQPRNTSLYTIHRREHGMGGNV